MPAATAAAEPPLLPPGVRVGSHGLRVGPVGRVLGGRAHRELVEVRLADDDRAGRLEARHHGRGIGRHEPAQHARRGGGRDAGRAQVVLERERHAEQRRRAAGRVARVASMARAAFEGALVDHGVEGADARLLGLDARERRPRAPRWRAGGRRPRRGRWPAPIERRRVAIRGLAGP